MSQKRNDVVAAIDSHWSQLTAPTGSLARLHGLVRWLGGTQNRAVPRLRNRALILAIGEHGVANCGISAYPSSVTGEMAANIRNGGAVINQLCRQESMTMRVVDCRDLGATEIPDGSEAMSEQKFATAIERGRAAVLGNEDLIAVGELGIGNTTIAAALCLASFGGEAAQWTGRGTGIDDTRWHHKCFLVEKIASSHAHRRGIDLLRCAGGFEFVALWGAIDKAKRLGIPVVLDGYATCAAVAPEFVYSGDDVISHCQAGHVSSEQGHHRLLSEFGLQPLLDLSLGLGEGSGAVLATSVISSALAIYTGTATFVSADVSNRAVT